MKIYLIIVVQNLKITMDECYRVLKPGGSLLAVFPQFLQPFESHLNFVTNLPCIHWFFNSDKVSKNYYEILKERGDSAKWYNGEKFSLEKWEKLPTLNGTSIRKFEKILEKNNWSNGENNNDGINDNLSWNCGAEGPTDDQWVNDLRRRQVKNNASFLQLPVSH